jgi:hypothetical protein
VHRPGTMLLTEGFCISIPPLTKNGDPPSHRSAVRIRIAHQKTITFNSLSRSGRPSRNSKTQGEPVTAATSGTGYRTVDGAGYDNAGSRQSPLQHTDATAKTLELLSPSWSSIPEDVCFRPDERCRILVHDWQFRVRWARG